MKSKNPILIIKINLLVYRNRPLVNHATINPKPLNQSAYHPQNPKALKILDFA
jgi:hypothetical protein